MHKHTHTTLSHASAQSRWVQVITFLTVIVYKHQFVYCSPLLIPYKILLTPWATVDNNNYCYYVYFQFAPITCNYFQCTMRVPWHIIMCKNERRLDTLWPHMIQDWIKWLRVGIKLCIPSEIPGLHMQSIAAIWADTTQLDDSQEITVLQQLSIHNSKFSNFHGHSVCLGMESAINSASTTLTF